MRVLNFNRDMELGNNLDVVNLVAAGGCWKPAYFGADQTAVLGNGIAMSLVTASTEHFHIKFNVK